ncbi:hypothetical protein QFC20_005429 [Naganishia adeliensis]|uniref:Uncharacterized protein n=1 Tax=Naganishia adeliensis TaxID=92952 RepID=A0ACC2VMH4_9TREE|nr:hypothetical protein QFC20_005429 [Naganishia adeliensis]
MSPDAEVGIFHCSVGIETSTWTDPNNRRNQCRQRIMRFETPNPICIPVDIAVVDTEVQAIEKHVTSTYCDRLVEKSIAFFQALDVKDDIEKTVYSVGERWRSPAGGTSPALKLLEQREENKVDRKRKLLDDRSTRVAGQLNGLFQDLWTFAYQAYGKPLGTTEVRQFLDNQLSSFASDITEFSEDAETAEEELAALSQQLGKWHTWESLRS